MDVDVTDDAQKYLCIKRGMQEDQGMYVHMIVSSIMYVTYMSM